jgi:hypothetical protein
MIDFVLKNDIVWFYLLYRATMIIKNEWGIHIVVDNTDSSEKIRREAVGKNFLELGVIQDQKNKDTLKHNAQVFDIIDSMRK